MESTNPATERRAIGIDNINSDRIIEGVVVRYGDFATLDRIRERFVSGAFGDSLNRRAIRVNFQHDRTRPLAVPTFEDSADALRVRFQLPNTADGNDTMELLKTGVLSGISMEFSADEESYDPTTRIREIRRATMLGVAVVDYPAYRDSVATFAKRYHEDRVYGQETAISPLRYSNDPDVRRRAIEQMRKLAYL